MSKCRSQVITCKAAVIWGIGEPLAVEEIQVEPPKSSEVRLKMLYASVCHTDITRANGFPFPLFPRVLGHEGVGVVESVGEGVKGLKEGDTVIPTFVGQCDDCENCESPETNLCLKYFPSFTGLMADDTSRMSIRGTKLYHFFTSSTWCEYTVVDSNYVVKIDPNCVDLPAASVISCGFSTGFGAAWKEARVKMGSSVAVFGLGAVGLGAIEGARIQGATKIIGIDNNGMKKERGMALGMSDFINPKDLDKSISEVVKDLSGGIGVDYCFECTGVPALINEALLSTKLGKGKVVVVGAGYESMNIKLYPLLAGRTLKGSMFGGLKIKSDLPILLHKYHLQEFHIDELLTHEITLEDIHKAFDILKQPDCVKLVIRI